MSKTPSERINEYADAINVMCTKGSPILGVLMSMRKYAEDLKERELTAEDARQLEKAATAAMNPAGPMVIMKGWNVIIEKLRKTYRD